MHREPLPVPDPPRNPLPAMALIVAMLGCLLSGVLGYAVGRRMERETQFGQVLAMQQLERDLWGAVRSLDSISMRYQVTVLRASTRPQNRAKMP